MAENDSTQTPSASSPDNQNNEPNNMTTPAEPSAPSRPNVPSMPSAPSQPNVPSTPSTPSRPTVPSMPSAPSQPTVPSTPSIPSRPTVPSTPSVPSRPNVPIIPIIPSVPSFPSAPVIPGNAYSQVRFINASTNTFPVNFSINGITYEADSQFGSVSSYQQISDGFHTVSVTRASGMQTLLLQQTFPFTAGQKYTMVLVDAREGGLEMIQVSDTGCNNLPAGYGCYRVANVSYSGSNFDIRLYNGDTIFRNVNFTQVTSYKRALAGNYTFYATAANFYSVIRELPVIIIGAVTGSSAVSSPLAFDNVTIRPGTRTTSYIMGNIWSSFRLQMLTVSDD